MKSFIILTIFYLSPHFVLCQDNISKLISSKKGGNTKLDKSLAIDERQNIGNDLYKKTLEQKQAIDINYSANINALFRKYDAQRKENEIGLYIVKGNSYLIKTSLLCLNDKLKVPIVCDITSKALTKVEIMVKEEMDNSTRKILKNGLDNVMNKAGKKAEDAIKANTNPQAFLEALDAQTNILDGLYKNLPNATNEDKVIVQAAMLKTIENEIRTGFKGIDAANSVTKTELEQLNKNVSSLSISFLKYAEDNQRKLNDIVETQRDINAQLGDINDRLGKTEKGVEFLQDFFFSRMSPDEKINALKLGMAGRNLDPQQRQDMIQKISLYQKQQQLVNDIQGYLQGATAIVGLARGLGLDPKLAAGLSKGIAIAAGAFNAAASIMSGNYIGAISAVAGLIGIGGPDVAAERHKEIMEALETIYKKIDIVEQKIDTLISRQIIILQNQKKTYDALIAISKQIDQNQNELRLKLEQIHRDIIYNRNLLTNYVKTQYTNCCHMIANDCETAQPDTIVNTEVNKFPTYNELVTRCKTLGPLEINGCYKIINEIQKDDGTFDNPIFNLQSSEDPKNYQWVDTFIKAVHEPLIDFLNSDTTLNKLTLNQKRTSLFLPSTTIESLNKKINQIQINKLDATNDKKYRKAFSENIETPLWFEAVEKHANTILNIHYYRMAIDPTTTKPYSKEELINDNVNKAGFNDLQKGLVLVDYAIAQQNLYSGDVLLPILYNIWSMRDSNNLARKDRVVQLLNHNSLLAHNFIIYSIAKEVNRGSTTSYSLGYISKDTNNFKLNFQNDWSLRWSDSSTIDSNKVQIPQGWSTKIGSQYYEMPSPEDIKAARLSYSQNIQTLINLKTRILEEMDTYTIYNSMTGDQRRSFNTLNLLTIPEQPND